MKRTIAFLVVGFALALALVLEAEPTPTPTASPSPKAMVPPIKIPERTLITPGPIKIIKPTPTPTATLAPIKIPGKTTPTPTVGPIKIPGKTTPTPTPTVGPIKIPGKTSPTPTVGPIKIPGKTTPTPTPKVGPIKIPGKTTPTPTPKVLIPGKTSPTPTVGPIKIPGKTTPTPTPTVGPIKIPGKTTPTPTPKILIPGKITPTPSPAATATPSPVATATPSPVPDKKKDKKDKDVQIWINIDVVPPPPALLGPPIYAGTPPVYHSVPKSQTYFVDGGMAPVPESYTPPPAEAPVEVSPTALRAWNGQPEPPDRAFDQTRIKLQAAEDGSMGWEFYWKTTGPQAQAARWEVATVPFVGGYTAFPPAGLVGYGDASINAESPLSENFFAIDFNSFSKNFEDGARPNKYYMRVVPVDLDGNAIGTPSNFVRVDLP